MDIGFYLATALSAGLGSALVQIIFQLGFSHWLQKKYYDYTLDKADRRNCADRIIDIIGSKHYQSWSNLNDDIYDKAYKLSDKLLSLGEKEHSERLDKYVSTQRYAHEILGKVKSGNITNQDEKEFVDSQHQVDVARIKLIDTAKRLKKK